MAGKPYRHKDDLKIPMGIGLPRWIVDAIDAKADAAGRSRSAIVQNYIEDGLRRESCDMSASRN